MSDYKITVDRDWLDNEKKLKLINDSYSGGEIYKKGKYLYQYYIEDDVNILKQRYKRSYLYNITRNVLDKYKSFIFSSDPTREFKNDSEFFIEFLNNMSIDGKDSQGFFEEVYTNLLLDEKVYILVDKRTNNIDEDIKPFCQSIKRGQVLKHSFDENNDLEYICWYEEGEKDGGLFDKNQNVYYFYALDKYNFYKFNPIPTNQVSKKQFTYDNIIKTFKSDEVEIIENNYGFVPIVTFERESIFEEIADNQREIYNILSLRQEVLFKLCFSPLVIQGALGELSALNYQSVIELDPNSNIQPFRIPYPVDTIDKYNENIKEILTENNKIAYPYDINSDIAKTATEKQLDFNDTNKKLQKHVSDMEKIELQIYEMLNKIYGNEKYNTEEILINYNKEFQLNSLENEIRLVDLMRIDLQLPEEMIKEQLKKVTGLIFNNFPEKKKKELVELIDKLKTENEFDKIGDEIEINSKK